MNPGTIAVEQLTAKTDLIIKRGGEGTIYADPHDSSKVIKIYNAPIGSNDRERILYQIKNPETLPAGAFGPKTPIYGKRNELVGYTMDRLPHEAVTSRMLFDPMWCHQHRLGLEKKLEILIRLHLMISECHQNGYIIGDLNPDNVCITPQGHVYLIDTCSWSWGPYRGTLHQPEWIHPRLYDRLGKTAQFEQKDDWWSFAVIAFNAIHNAHPYSGVKEDCLLPTKRIFQRYPIWDASVKPPQYFKPLGILTPALEKFFIQLFQRDQKIQTFPLKLLTEYKKGIGKCARCTGEHSKERGCPNCERKKHIRFLELKQRLVEVGMGEEIYDIFVQQETGEVCTATTKGTTLHLHFGNETVAYIGNIDTAPCLPVVFGKNVVYVRDGELQAHGIDYRLFKTNEPRNPDKISRTRHGIAYLSKGRLFVLKKQKDVELTSDVNTFWTADTNNIVLAQLKGEKFQLFQDEHLLAEIEVKHTGKKAALIGEKNIIITSQTGQNIFVNVYDSSKGEKTSTFEINLPNHVHPDSINLFQMKDHLVFMCKGDPLRFIIASLDGKRKIFQETDFRAISQDSIVTISNGWIYFKSISGSKVHAIKFDLF